MGKRSLTVFSVLSNLGLLMNASLEYLSSEHPAGFSSSALVPCCTNLDLGVNQSSQAGCSEKVRKEIYKTPGHLHCTLTSLLQHCKHPRK